MSDGTKYRKVQAVARYSLGQVIIDEMNRQGISRLELASRAGYKNITKGMRRLDGILDGSGELVLLRQFSEALGIAPDRLERALAETAAERATEQAEAEQQREAHLRAIFRPIINVETEYRRPSPLHIGIMFFDTLKRIHLPASILKRSFDHQLAWAMRAVPKHYSAKGGKAPSFGQITGYAFRFSYDEAILLDVNGKIVDEHARATPDPLMYLAIGRTRMPASTFAKIGSK